MFNWLDYLLIFFLLMGAAFGIFRGYRWELYRTGCLIIATVLSISFHDKIDQFAPDAVRSADTNLLGYAIIFFATLIVTFLIGILIFKARHGDTEDSRLLGGLCGLLKNAILCSILIIGLRSLGGETTKTHIDSARIATAIHQTVFTAISKIREGF